MYSIHTAIRKETKKMVIAITVILAKLVILFLFLPTVLLGYIAYGIHSVFIEPLSKRHGIIAKILTFIVAAPAVFACVCAIICTATCIMEALR